MAFEPLNYRDLEMFVGELIAASAAIEAVRRRGGATYRVSQERLRDELAQ